MSLMSVHMIAGFSIGILIIKTNLSFDGDDNIEEHKTLAIGAVKFALRSALRPEDPC